MTKPPTVSYAGPSGTGAPSRVAHLVRTPQPGHGPGAVGHLARPVVRDRSCSSLTSPTISSTTSSRVTTPDGAAVLVDDDGQLVARPRAGAAAAGRAGSSRAPEQRRHHERRHRHVGAPVVRHRDRPLDVDDAVDVVPVLADHREPGVAGARASRSTSSAVAVRSIEVHRTRGLITSAAVLLAEVRATASPAGRCRRRACRPRPSAAPARRAPGGCGRRRAPPAG